MLPHRLSFYDQLPVTKRRKRTSKNPNLNVGAFGRMDIGIIVEALQDELLSRGLDTDRVLYTDTDVLFARDIDHKALSTKPLPTFAAGTEVFSPALNSGVMLINATAWARHYVPMIAYGQARNFRFLSYDQTWVQEYFKRVGDGHGWEPLEDSEYNARGFMHPQRPQRRSADGELAPTLPRLWHWHGFKPKDVECWHNAIHTGRWPIRAWRNTIPTGCTGKTRPRCVFMPVHNSGCRYFGRLTAVLGMTPCYLRTYTYLLQQHRRMLRIARALEREAANVTLQVSALRTWKLPTTTACEARGDARVAALQRAWRVRVEPSLRKPPPFPSLDQMTINGRASRLAELKREGSTTV